MRIYFEVPDDAQLVATNFLDPEFATLDLRTKELELILSFPSRQKREEFIQTVEFVAHHPLTYGQREEVTA